MAAGWNIEEADWFVLIAVVQYVNRSSASLKLQEIDGSQTQLCISINLKFCFILLYYRNLRLIDCYVLIFLFIYIKVNKG